MKLSFHALIVGPPRANLCRWFTFNFRLALWKECRIKLILYFLRDCNRHFKDEPGQIKFRWKLIWHLKKIIINLKDVELITENGDFQRCQHNWAGSWELRLNTKMEHCPIKTRTWSGNWLSTCCMEPDARSDHSCGRSYGGSKNAYEQCTFGTREVGKWVV